MQGKYSYLLISLATVPFRGRCTLSSRLVQACFLRDWYPAAPQRSTESPHLYIPDSVCHFSAFSLSVICEAPNKIKSRPQQKMLPTALSRTSLLPSAAAVLRALYTSFITSGFSELFSDDFVDSKMWVKPSCFLTTISL